MQQRERFPHRVAVRERAEILAFGVFRATMDRQPGMRIAAQEDIRIRFVIAQQHVIARLVELDVVVLQQQRFGLGVSHRHVDILDLRHQRFGFTAGEVASEIAGKALFEIFGLADVDNRAAGVIHTVDARLAGDGFQERFGIKNFTH